MSTILSSLLGSPNTRSHTPQQMERGLRMIWGTEYPLHDSGMLEQIYTVKGSEKKTESDIVTAELGVAIATSEGADPTFDAMQEVWKVQATHVKYTLGLEFTEEAIEDNLYQNLMQTGGRALARSMAYTRQVQAFSNFNDLTEVIYNVNSTDYGLLSTTHFMVNGSTWSNRPSVATGLSIESLEERLQAWTVGMVTQRGFKYNFRPEILMVGAADESLAFRLVNSPNRPQGADNDKNWVQSQRSLKVVVNPHMTDDGRWFLLAAKQNTKLTHFDRVKAGIRRFDNNPTGNRQFISRMRISKMCAGAEGISGSPGS